MSWLDDFGFEPKRLGILIIVIVLAITAYTTWRNARIDALAHAALEKKPDAVMSRNRLKKVTPYAISGVAFCG